MREQIHEAIVSVESFDDIKAGLLGIFEKLRGQLGENARIGYVAGIVNSDGPELREINIQRLILFTEKAEEKFKMPTFSAADIFPEVIFKKITKTKFDPEDFINFWKDIFNSGYITDIFMTPRWQESYGASDEHRMAKELGLNIHYLEDDLIK